MTVAALTRFVLMFAGLGLAGNAFATLMDRGGGMIYDDVLNITWLQDANYAQTSGHDADGQMSWGAADSWAANLVYGGYSDWRLATMDNTSPASAQVSCHLVTAQACADNRHELGYMFFYNLGGAFLDNLTGNQTSAGVALNNIQHWYWSATQFNGVDDNYEYFSFGSGNQSRTHEFNLFAAWAVRDGDAGAAVAEPASLALLGLGLFGAAWGRRKEARSRDRNPAAFR